MKRPLALLAALIAGASANAQTTLWPPLPKTEYITGRAANKEDVAAGRAVFVAENNGVQVGQPAKLTIPQYAWYRDGAKKVPVVVIQAEDVGPQRIVGAKLVTGTFVAGMANDFELLGQVPPK